MSKLNIKLVLTGLLICGFAPVMAYGQSADDPSLISDPSLINELSADESVINIPARTSAKPAQSQNQAQKQVQPLKRVRRRINKTVEPIPYWVDSASLNIRDNPVAGRIIDKADYGQRVLAYSQYENWVKVSKPGTSEKWVNSDFLSNSRISWASYNRRPATRSSDIVSVRIKDPSNRKTRVFGVRLKSAQTGNALITTREDTAEGVFFQNRFVSCNDQSVVGVRLVGEGYSFLAAQNDVRGSGLDIYGSEQVEDAASGSIESAISVFACKAQPF